MSEAHDDRERWQRVKQLVADAAVRPPGERARFLMEACPDEASIRRDAESLLAAHDAADDRFERGAPAAAALAGFRLPTGRRLGPYQIVESIGEGGMGQVYRARDARLHRDVAIKVLPAIAAADPDRIARFTREAQALAALNHPHIAAIYRFEECDGIQALVLELVEGPTLADRLMAGPIPVEEALPVAREIAEALEAAHEHGIIHRDLKPANIKLRPDGMVKVLDFGLAKVLEPVASTSATTSPTVASPAMTRTGILLGTAAYMSPEQACGKIVDKRADIWAFGCVLFEMLAGRRAFQGETVSDTLASVMRDAPPLRVLPASTPPRVRLLIARCLERDPKRRLRDIGDARIELDAVDVAAGRASVLPLLPSRRVSPGLVLTALILVALTAAITSWVSRSASHERSTVAPLLRLTSDAGLTTDPAISPDGKLMVYASDRAGRDNLDLWVQQINGAPIRLTSDAADEYEPAFSPDGTRIVFRSDRDGGGLYVMPALGGQARLIAKGGRQPRFSPDGSRIAFVTSEAAGRGGITQGVLFVVPSTGGTPQKLVGGDVGAASPVWSPDGALLLFAAGQYRIDDWRITPSDHAGNIVLRLETFQKSGLADLTPREWLPDNRVVFAAKSGDSSHIFEIGLSPPSWLTRTWRLDAAPRPLTLGTAQDEAPVVASSAAAGGRRMAFASASHNEHVWSVALDTSRPGSAGKVTELTDGSDLHVFPSISADGTKLAFIAHTAYNDEVSLLDLKTGKTSVLSTAVSRKYQTHIRADGSQVFYGDVGDLTTAPATVPDGAAIYAVGTSGGSPEPLCQKCNVFVWDWSADRRRLLVWGPRKPWVAATVVDRATNAARVFFERPNVDLYNFELSPDGRWVVFHANAAAGNRIYVAPFDGEQPPPEDRWVPITDGTTLEDKTHWSPDGGWIYALSNRDGFFCVWAYPIEPRMKAPLGPPVAVFHAHGARLSLRNANLVSQQLSVARDKVIFNQGEITGNIWMTEIR